MNNKAVYASKQKSANQNWLASIARNYWVFMLFFIFKFFEWRFNRQMQTEIKLENFKEEIPTPLLANGSADNCPICRKKVQIPVALKTSNFVYCFACLNDFVDTNKKCPQSGLNVEPQDEDSE